MKMRCLRDLMTAPPPDDEVVPLLATALRSLADVHARGEVHRHVTPDTVLVAEGAARLDPESTAPEGGIAAGAVVGEPRYMAPETLAEAAYSEATDLYGLGVCFYELLSRHHPHDHSRDEPLVGFATRVCTEDARPLAPRASVREGLESVVMGLVRRERTTRYASARAALRDLSAAFPDAGCDWSDLLSG